MKSELCITVNYDDIGSINEFNTQLKENNRSSVSINIAPLDKKQHGARIKIRSGDYIGYTIEVHESDKQGAIEIRSNGKAIKSNSNDLDCVITYAKLHRKEICDWALDHNKNSDLEDSLTKLAINFNYKEAKKIIKYKSLKEALDLINFR